MGALPDSGHIVSGVSAGVAGRQGPGLVGRRAELERWSGLLAGLPARGGLLIVSGEPGVGKTHLQRRFTGMAAEAGVRVLRMRCREGDAASAYRPLIETLAPLARPGRALAADVPDAYRTAVRTVRTLWEGGDADDSPLAIAESAVRTLSLLAGADGLVLAVDDAQWADPDTFAVLQHLARTVDATPVTVSVTVRAGTSGDQYAARLADAEGAVLLELPRLDRAEQAALISARLGSEPPADLVEFVSARAEGLPLAIEELLTDLVRSGALRREDGRWWVEAGSLHRASSPSIDAAVRARLAGVSPQAVPVAVAVALRDDETTWDEAAEITAQPGDVVAAALRELVEADLLVPVGRARFRYRHGLIRDAVLAAASPSLAQDLAGQVATDLSRRAGTDPDRLARLSALWMRAGNADAAARAGTAAAWRWLTRGTAATAVASALAAAESRAAGPLRAAAVDALTEALTRTGHFAEALDRLEDALAGAAVPEGGWRAATYCRAARCALETGAPAAARHHLDIAERVGGADAEACTLRTTLAFEAGESEASATLARQAVALAEASGSAHELGAALLVEARVLRGRDPADALPVLERLLALAESHELGTLHERALLELGLIDRLTTGRCDRLERAHQLAIERLSLHTQAVAETNLWSVLLQRGELDEAERMLRHAVELSRRHRLRTALPATAQLVLHEASRGRGDAAAALAQTLRGTPAEDGAAFYAALYRDDPRTALAVIAHAAGHLNRIPDARPAPVRGLHALLCAVERDDAQAAADAAAAGYGSWYNRGLVRLAEAVIAGRRDGSQAADALADAAYRDLEPFTPIAALATTLVATRASEDGWGAPDAWLISAREHFAALGNESMRRRCDALLRSAGFPVPRRGRGDAEVPARLRQLGITSREMDVLLLVAEKLTNAQIAQRLTVSPRTVDTHVSRLIAKAGVAGRADLAALLS